MKFEYGPILSTLQLEDIRTTFWVIYADETKDNLVVNAAAYDVLKALETYRKSLNGQEM